MKRFHLLAACCIYAMLAGCASSGNGRLAQLSQQQTAAMLAIGQTTKHDVRGMLGEPSITKFPSEQEVWFYRLSGNAAELIKYVPLLGPMTSTGTTVKELKILFAADGRVKKYKLQDIHEQ